MLIGNLQKILLLTIITLWTYTYALTSITRMKALVLYAKSPIKSVTEALDAYGIEYEEWDATSIGENKKLTPKLYDKRPLFYMIVVDGSLEVYNEKKKIWESALTENQWKELEDYEASNHVHRVVVNNYPKPQSDNKEWGGYEKSQVIEQKIVCADNDITKKIFNDARIKRSAPLTSEGLIHHNIQNTDDVTVIPILYFKPNNIIIKKTLAAAIFDIGDGREVLSFYIQFTPESTTIAILNHLWITWASRGLIPGYRRIFFTPQVENVFLNTPIVDDTTSKDAELKDALTKKYRATTKDYEGIIHFMSKLSKSKKLNEGSSLKIELAFNGQGITDATAQYGSSSSNEKRTISTANNLSEKDIFIKEVNKYWNPRHNTYTKDEIFNFFSDINHRIKFNWVSNTYSNDVLLDASEQEIVNEILNNIESAMHLGLISRNLDNSELWWSKECIGTRGSLGFTDAKVVNILKKYNINFGLGNSLRNDINHPKNSYLPWKSTTEDFHVIPRNKRLLLRWASSPKESIWLYNKFHNPSEKEGDHHITNYVKKEKRMHKKELKKWHNILESESDEAVLSLLKLKHDPFVFNQSNLKVLSKNGYTSIISLWIKSTVKKLNAYVYWPVISAKSDDLAHHYNLRAIQKECGAEISYSHNDTHIFSVQVSSSKPCKVPITVGGNIVQKEYDSSFTFEKIGTDPLTVWINAPGDNISKIINLNPPLSYFDKSIIHFNNEESFEPDSGVEGDDEMEEGEHEEIEEQKASIAVTSKNIKMAQIKLNNDETIEGISSSKNGHHRRYLHRNQKENNKNKNRKKVVDKTTDFIESRKMKILSKKELNNNNNNNNNNYNLNELENNKRAQSHMNSKYSEYNRYKVYQYSNSFEKKHYSTDDIFKRINKENELQNRNNNEEKIDDGEEGEDEH